MSTPEGMGIGRPDAKLQTSGGLVPPPIQESTWLSTALGAAGVAVAALSVAAGMLLALAAAASGASDASQGLLLGLAVAIGGGVQGMILMAIGEALTYLRSMARRLSMVSVNSYLSAQLLEQAVNFQQHD